MFHTSEQQQQQVQHQKALKGEAKGEKASTERLRGKARQVNERSSLKKGKSVKEAAATATAAAAERHLQSVRRDFVQN